MLLAQSSGRFVDYSSANQRFFWFLCCDLIFLLVLFIVAIFAA